MVDSHLVEQRLAAIRDRLDRIARMTPADRAAFLGDRTAQEIVAFNLFVAFQRALDLAAHLIADRGLELPATAREHFEVLGRAGLLSPAVASAMAGCAPRSADARSPGSRLPTRRRGARPCRRRRARHRSGRERRCAPRSRTSPSRRRRCPADNTRAFRRNPDNPGRRHPASRTAST